MKLSYKLVFREGLLIAAVGAILAFAANAISPRGLSLGRNYFPDDSSTTSPASNRSVVFPTNSLSPEALTIARLKEKGLQLLNIDETRQLSNDPRLLQGLIVFIDARPAHEYEEGHIPGAYQLDYYYLGDQMGPVLAACQPAQEIVVYCNGGKCDASELLTLMLRDQVKIPGTKLFIFTGGITEWNDKNLPVETGPRNSGKLLDRTHVTK